MKGQLVFRRSSQMYCSFLSFPMLHLSFCFVSLIIFPCYRKWDMILQFILAIRESFTPLHFPCLLSCAEPFSFGAVSIYMKWQGVSSPSCLWTFLMWKWKVKLTARDPHTSQLPCHNVTELLTFAWSVFPHSPKIKVILQLLHGRR